MIKVIDRPNIVLKEIVMQYPDNVDLKQQANDIGRFPYIEIGRLVIEGTQIQTLSIYNDKFLPRINMSFTDTSNQLIDPLFPVDNSILKLFIQSSNDNLLPVRMDFKITTFTPSKAKKGENNDVVFELDGILNVDYLYNSFFTSYNDTSFNILKQLAKEAGLGFATNIENTNDKMVWINPSLTYMEFIQEIVRFSFIGLDTFLFTYIDFHYNLNYVDIEKALNESIKDQKGIVGDKFINNDEIDKENVDKTGNLILVNNPDNKGSNLYIETYNISNSSTLVNLDIGYLYYASYYDINGNTVYDLILDTISTPGPDGKGLIMKGGVGEIADIQRYSSDNVFEGKIDTDNVHKYFLYAYKNNERNLSFLEKLKMKISLSSPNYNLYRFQKVEVNLFKVNDIANQDDVKDDSKTGTSQEERTLNQRLSGEWLIIAITYNYGEGDGFSQEITLVKRELGFNDNDYNKDKSY